MAQVTVELRNLLKSNFKLFDFPYKFDDPLFKAQIEEDIINYYYDYEIGQETPDMFKRKFKARFTRMIGYYNELHNTTLLSYNPLTNYSIAEAMEQLAKSLNKVDGSTSNTASGRGTSQLDTTNEQSSVADSVTTSEGTDSNTNTVTNDLSTTNTNTKTNNLKTVNSGTGSTSSTEKTSDYPQQGIGTTDYLSGSRTGTTTSKDDSTSDSTGTVTDSGAGTNTGTVKNVGSGTSTGTATSENTSTTDGSTSQTGSTTSNDQADSTNSTTGTGSVDTEYSKTIEGITGTTYQELVRQERANLMRLTNMIIDELKPCFILVH